MQQKYRSALLAAFGFVLAASSASAAPLELDRTHSRVGFTAETLLFDVDGEFNEYQLNVEGNPDKPEKAKVKVTIPVSSIDTDNEKRDNHLKSEDFFNASKYPNIVFTSTGINKKGDRLIVKGTLTMHGKTQPVTVPFQISKGKNGAGKAVTTYKAKVTIDRTDFGVGTESVAAKISLEDEVELDLLIVTFDN